MKKIGIIVGSLREGSFNKRIAEFVGTKLETSFEVKRIDISALPFYNQDLESAPPQEWVAFRDQVKAMDGIILVTPEYNRSFSAVLKNALDVGSRPPKFNAWSEKPIGVISSSPGKIGGFGANNHLRQVLACINTYVMPQPEAYLGEIHTAIDKNGDISNETTAAFLEKFANAFALWIEKIG